MLVSPQMLVDLIASPLDCWFFDQNPSAQRLNPALTAEYNRLKFAPPEGPQFQVSLFPMKKYRCHCNKCGNNFTQNVQKGVDNGIATKILSLAYENICDRFILFAGDGDFYSSLSHVRNVLRKDIWVIGYRGTVSGDLQQLASRVIWMEELWPQVQSIHPARSLGQGDEERREGRRRGDGRKKNEDEVRWFEDHKGEHFHLSNGSESPPSDFGSGRQVVIAPVESESSNREKQPARGRGRGRDERMNGRGRGRNGRGRNRSRSRGRSCSRPPNSKELAVSKPAAEITVSGPVGAGTKRKKGSTGEGKRPDEGRSGKKRKRNGNNERGRSKRGGGHGDKEADNVPVVTLSDFSSDEDFGDKPFPLTLPVPVGEVITAQSRDAAMDEIGARAKVINLASDTESE
ncbi:hypothetical protein DVH05_011917 [Phytophthora capsici]|nr:hypothetical protein DVH05_011917 [Phytophthora capsici]|eukprot:jgi/Phyca11/532195/estExt2_fgenesh1_pg.C_PHYCAscaffold_40138